MNNNEPKICRTCFYWRTTLAVNIGVCWREWRKKHETMENNTCTSYRPRYFEYGSKAI